MKEIVRSPGFRVAVALLVVAAGLLTSCGATLPAPSAPSAQPASAAPVKPDLSLPPAPARSEDEVWKEAFRRADALAPLVQADVAAINPGPLPSPQVPASTSAPVPVVARPIPGGSGRAAPPSLGGGVPPEPPSQAAAAPQKPGLETPRPAIPSVQVMQRFTTENGLPSGRITALYVDDDDAWVGTADAGVARFNFQEGNWIITKVEDGIASNRITDIIRYKGRVFVATQDGVSIWDGVSWVTQDTEGKVKMLNAVFKVHDGVLWVAARTMFGGLLTFDGERWKDRSTIKPGAVLNNVSDFAFSGNTLWIGTTNRGLLRFDGKDWSGFTVADGIASNFVYTMGVKGEACYVGGCCGLSAYEDGTWKIYDIAEGLPHSTVNAIAVDGGLVWLGSKKGLALFDGFSFASFYTENGLTDDRITALFVKGTDVWVGTANGLNRLAKSY